MRVSQRYSLMRGGYKTMKMRLLRHEVEQRRDKERKVSKELLLYLLLIL